MSKLPLSPHGRKSAHERKGARRAVGSLRLPGDPAGRQKKEGGIGWGGLLVGAAGSVFVGYVWNVGGMHTALDDLFGGWNQSVHGQDELVAKWYLAALPVIAGAFAVVLAYWMLSGAARKVQRAHRKSKKRRLAPAVVAAPVAACPASGMKFVRPVRLAGARDDSVLVQTPR